MGSELGLFETCRVAIQVMDLSTCKPLGFDLLGWVTILTAAIAIFIFLIRKLIKSAIAGTAKLGWRPWRRRFTALCAAIETPLVENGRLFREFGPNSDRGGDSSKVVRHDLTVWKQLIPKVVANNTQIRELISANHDVIPLRHRPLFVEWINHIDAFEAHALDDLADYRDNQFPVQVVEVVRNRA